MVAKATRNINLGKIEHMTEFGPYSCFSHQSPMVIKPSTEVSSDKVHSSEERVDDLDSSDKETTGDIVKVPDDH